MPAALRYAGFGRYPVTVQKQENEMDGQDFNFGLPEARGPREAQIYALGQLSYLATYCPLHRQFPASALSRLFIPAINHNCVRFFENEDGSVAAALIWARLSDEVGARMLFDQKPPNEAEWVGGSNLWFLDLLAPFGHGRQAARILARDPPGEPFYFARMGKGGAVRKVMRGDVGARPGERLRRCVPDPVKRTVV